MYNHSFLDAQGRSKKEDLDRIEQKFYAAIPREMQEYTVWPITADVQNGPFLQTKTGTIKFSKANMQRNYQEYSII